MACRTTVTLHDNKSFNLSDSECNVGLGGTVGVDIEQTLFILLQTRCKSVKHFVSVSSPVPHHQLD